MTPEQIPPPPRIKAWPWNGKRISGQWHVAGLGETTDYVRGDLFAAQAAELERLRAERDVLRKVITEGRRAIGDHFAPHDCYATGPMTGDPIRDLVQCPACSFIAMHDTALKGGTQ